MYGSRGLAFPKPRSAKKASQKSLDTLAVLIYTVMKQSISESSAGAVSFVISAAWLGFWCRPPQTAGRGGRAAYWRTVEGSTEAGIPGAKVRRQERTAIPLWRMMMNYCSRRYLRLLIP